MLIFCPNTDTRRLFLQFIRLIFIFWNEFCQNFRFLQILSENKVSDTLNLVWIAFISLIILVIWKISFLWLKKDRNLFNNFIRMIVLADMKKFFLWPRSCQILFNNVIKMFRDIFVRLFIFMVNFEIRLRINQGFLIFDILLLFCKAKCLDKIKLFELCHNFDSQLLFVNFGLIWLEGVEGKKLHENSPRFKTGRQSFDVIFLGVAAKYDIIKILEDSFHFAMIVLYFDKIPF